MHVHLSRGTSPWGVNFLLTVPSIDNQHVTLGIDSVLRTLSMPKETGCQDVFCLTWEGGAGDRA